jgi:hypothetical protein
VKRALAALLFLAACKSSEPAPARSDARAPSPSPEEPLARATLERAWLTCSKDEDCVVVEGPCTIAQSAVNASSRAKAEAAHAAACAGKPPSARLMMMPTPSCASGECRIPAP